MLRSNRGSEYLDVEFTDYLIENEINVSTHFSWYSTSKWSSEKEKQDVIIYGVNDELFYAINIFLEICLKDSSRTIKVYFEDILGIMEWS